MVQGLVRILILLCFTWCQSVVLGQENLYRQWERWSECSQSCGGGHRWRFRECIDWYNWYCWDVWQTQYCNTQQCGGAINGNWTLWSPWGACSVACGGGGSQSRTRTCTNPAPANGGRNCVGDASQTQPCATNPCPWNSWGPWGACSVTCGEGSQSRTRTCTNPVPSNGGRNCVGNSSQTQPCGTNTCPPPINGNWTLWSPWGACSVACGGGGSQSRTRTCTNPAPANGGRNCVGDASQTQPCATNPCPWNSWGPWGACSVTCGEGSQSRTRTCTNPVPSNGGRNCVGNSSQTQPCGTNTCPPPINGNWTLWSPWGACSVACGGGGSQSRTRTCTNPAPANGGRNCVGDASQTQPCATNPCPWNSWGPWGACSVACGGGNQSRSRTCTNPAPANGGRNCVGDASQTQPCATNLCPVHGNWTLWGSWGPCSVACGGGSQSRTRTCDRPAPANGGNNCSGPSSETQSCASNTCSPPINGNWSSWGSWGSCSVTCGGGSQSRTRSCTSPAPSNGGSNCSGSSFGTQSCATSTCLVCQAGQTVYDRCGQRCVCGAGGTLTQCTRIRKEFTSMTTAERERYIRVIKTASTNSRYKPRYDALILLHKNIFTGFGIHERQHFLTWHRWYILQYENLLREVDCNFTVSYWNWADAAGRPWGTGASDVWNSGNSGMGGNGQAPNQCVTTGPFRQGVWRLMPPVETPPDCLKRNFMGTPPNAVELGILLNIAPSSFNDFELTLRGRFHDNVHCLIGGTMCEIDSAAAPEFFLHHGFVDKIWEDWQRRSSAHHNAFFSTITATLPPQSNTFLPRQFLNNSALPGGVRVEYAPIGNRQIANVVRRLRSLTSRQLQSIPRISSSPISRRTSRLFRLSAAERRRLRQLSARFQPRFRSRGSSSRSGIAAKLGFDPRILNSIPG